MRPHSYVSLFPLTKKRFSIVPNTRKYDKNLFCQNKQNAAKLIRATEEFGSINIAA